MSGSQRDQRKRLSSQDPLLLAEESTATESVLTLGSMRILPGEEKYYHATGQEYWAAHPWSAGFSLIVSPEPTFVTRIETGETVAAEPATGVIEILTHAVAERQLLDLSELLRTLAQLTALPNQVRRSKVPSLQVNRETIDKAREFLLAHYRLMAQKSFQWKSPRVTTNGDGDVTFEWRANDQVLAISIMPDGTVEGLHVWGPHIWKQMEEYIDPTEDRLAQLHLSLFS